MTCCLFSNCTVYTHIGMSLKLGNTPTYSTLSGIWFSQPWFSCVGIPHFQIPWNRRIAKSHGQNGQKPCIFASRHAQSCGRHWLGRWRQRPARSFSIASPGTTFREGKGTPIDLQNPRFPRKIIYTWCSTSLFVGGYPRSSWIMHRIVLIEKMVPAKPIRIAILGYPILIQF